MSQLSEHFSVEELTASEYAARHGIDNKPPHDVLVNLADTAIRMEAVRSVLKGHSIHVNSGYRGPALNHAIGGVATSAHLTGHAVDFVCPQYGNPFEVAQAINAHIQHFDQLILEYGWVHISFDPRMRRQLLTKRSAAAPYEAGLHA